MKIVIALACLVALCTAAEESKQVKQNAGLVIANNRGMGPRYAGGNARPGANYGGYNGGQGGNHKGGIRIGRSVEKRRSNVVHVQPVVYGAFDMGVAKTRKYGGHHAKQAAGHRGGNMRGYHGGYRGIHAGETWGRKLRSTQ